MKTIVYSYFKMAIVIWLATLLFPGAISASTNGILVVTGLMSIATVALGIVLGIIAVTRKRSVTAKKIIIANILTYVYTWLCDVIIMKAYNTYSDGLDIRGTLPLIILSIVLLLVQLEWPNSSKKRTKRLRTVRYNI